MQKFQISIQSPCHENWALMTPEERGRFCSVCSKTVMDFTEQSEEEIERFIEEHRNEKLCGRFLKTQLQPIIEVPIKSLRSSLSPLQAFVMAVMIAFGTSLISCTTEKGQLVGEVVLSSAENIDETTTTLGSPAFISPEDTTTTECTVINGNVSVQEIPVNAELFTMGKIARIDTVE